MSIPDFKKLTKPLSSAILVPQKVATLGVLNLANNILKPFSEVLPKDMDKKVKDATSSDNNLSDTFKIGRDSTHHNPFGMPIYKP